MDKEAISAYWTWSLFISVTVSAREKINRNPKAPRIIEIAGRKLCSNILNIYGKEMAGSPLLPPTRGKMGR